MEAAVKDGYRHIDGAYLYGNEKEIGGALQKCFKEGVVKRQDLFITSKLSYVVHALVCWSTKLGLKQSWEFLESMILIIILCVLAL